MRSTPFVLILALVASGCVRVAAEEPSGVQIPRASRILAEDGSVLGTIGVGSQIPVTLAGVSPYMVKAILAAEDADFYHHRGLYFPALVRAFLANLTAGRVVQGGSTITQQLAKLRLAGSAGKRTLKQKVKEAVLAISMEGSRSKDQILEEYLNLVYFGRQAYGVEAAARAYFGKHASELRLEEAALLAGMVSSPSRFSPDTPAGMEQARARRNWVLERMASLGFVDPGEAKKAQEAAITVLPDTGVRWQAPHFVSWVEYLLETRPTFSFLGSDEQQRRQALSQGGYTIVTTLDTSWQRAAEEAVSKGMQGQRSELEVALAAVEPGTGKVKAMVGSRGYYARKPWSKNNFALGGEGGGSWRQAGSSFKPFVLLAALEKGISPDRKYSAAAPVYIGPPCLNNGAPWRVENVEGQGGGEMTVREATVHSVNAVFAQLIRAVGPSKVAQVARKLGVDHKFDEVCAVGLGAGGASPLEMAGAFAALAAGGTFARPWPIAEVRDAEGRILYRADFRGSRVLSQAEAYLVTSILGEVVARGTGTRANIHRPQAGKTGTADNNWDAWFVGYTPELSAAVWVGFPQEERPMSARNTGTFTIYGGNLPAPIWALFAGRALAGVPIREFPAPAGGLVRVKVDASRGCLPNAYTPPELVEEQVFLAGEEPKEVCAEPTGPPLAAVPDVVGLKAEAARARIEAQGFVAVEKAEDSEKPAGTVTRQDPRPGTVLPMGAAVTYWVSTGRPPESVVPDVLGLDQEEARAAIVEAGFSPRVIREPCADSGCPGPGKVWKQSPPAGSQAAKGSEVTIWVTPRASPGPAPTASPTP